MASAFYDQGLTLTPFRRMYGEFPDVALLADSLFAVPELQPDPMPPANHQARVGEVVSLHSRVRFAAALAAWRHDSLFDSFPNRMKRHPSFQSIVAEGNKAVPLIAAELRREPSFLFLALEEITGENPVSEDAQGNLQATVAAWLTWLRS